MGLIRHNNEDNFCFNGNHLPQDNCGLDRILADSISLRAPRVLGIFDGMGGEAHGETAAYIAACQFAEDIKNIKAFEPKELIRSCLIANDKICTEAVRIGEGLMGATVAVMMFDENRAAMVNLGDSKAFLCRDGEFVQISEDHTDKCFIEQNDIVNRKPRLTQHLGIEESDMVIEPYLWESEICEGDMFLLCSDGLTDMVPLAKIESILMNVHEPAECVSALINEALKNGGRDNVTVILGRVEG